MSDDKMIEAIDSAINQLVYDKKSIKKAYNYYEGVRDPNLFRHLEENYGIGTPTSVKFTPLVRKHIDVLVNEYISLPTRMRVSCKDDKTQALILKEKKDKINASIMLEYKKYLNNKILQVFQDGKEAFSDPEIDSRIELLKIELSNSFISDFQLAASNILEFIMLSRDVDFIVKNEALIKDLLICGCVYYKPYITKSGNLINYKRLHPQDTFIERNPNSKYLKNSYRAVWREHMSRIEVLHQFGEYLSEEDIKSLETNYRDLKQDQFMYVNTNTEFTPGDTISKPGILSGLEVTPSYYNQRGDESGYTRNNLYVVYNVEWLEVEKGKDGKYTMYRYEGARINNSIYVLYGKSEHITRSMEDPTKCCLGINGLFFCDEKGDPFSLINATADLLDSYDVINYQKESVLASAGIKGDWVDLSQLPNELGDNTAERLLKFKAYKKMLGVAPINTALNDAEFHNNTVYAGFDDTIKADTIQAYELAMQSIENICSQITGVSRERLANIEQRDAVSNVDTGIKMSAIITKQYFTAMDSIIKELLTDLLNLGKIAYKEGMTGTLILGDKLQQIFTALPEHFTNTDFDIHINDASDMIKDEENIKMFILNLVQAQLVDALTATNAMTSKSMVELRTNINEGLQLQEKKNGMAAQLKQQNELLQQQLQQMQQELQKTQAELQKQSAKDGDIAIQQEKLKVDWYVAQNNKELKEKELQIKQDQVKAEVLQLYDGNAKNDEIKNL